MTVRDSRGVEIEEGARVRASSGTEGVVVVAEPDHRDNVCVNWETAGYVGMSPRDLTVISDTVEVTVELPRDEYEAAKEAWRDWPRYENGGGGAAASRFRATVRDHPGSQEDR